MVERIGVFGGSFDPIHAAHIAVAVTAKYRLSLDRVLMMVAPDPWQKRDRDLAPAGLRMDMVVAACNGIDGIEPSDLEMRRSGPTYTIDTVMELSRPGREIVIILGSDAVARLDTWHRAAELQPMVTIAAVARMAPASPTVDGRGVRDPLTTAAINPGWLIETVMMPTLDISSTDIRARVAAAVPIDGIVPSEVVHRIRAHDLYTFEHVGETETSGA